MCGICGIVEADREKPADLGANERMMDSLRHRGPDAEGRHAGPGLVLGARRLSIIDHERGSQPMHSEGGEIILVCNGEIYNAPELRKELTSRGHRFAGASDVEVIVHLYEEFGVACLDRLRGMFALALWDDREDQLMLARDRLGIKPLCYAIGPDSELCFGSEAKAILASHRFEQRMNPRALADAITFGGPLFDRTMFEGIAQVEPGEVVLYRRGAVERRRYWDLAFAASEERSDTQWIALFREKLEETVRVHMRSDVEVGCWLSPGIDSSCVAMLASRAASRRIRSFSIGFDDPAFDELARHETLDHFDERSIDAHRITYPELNEHTLQLAIWHQERPLGLQLASLALADATAAHLKVVLTGQGADEILAGYRWYRREALSGWARTMLGVGEGIDRLAHMRPNPGGASIAALLSHDVSRQVRAHETEQWGFVPPERFQDWNRINRLAYVEAKTRLVAYITHGLDRMSMAHSLEARVPFLDHQLVELCASMPTTLKLRGATNKFVLRESMHGRLPDRIVRRRKRGLRTPPPDVLRGALEPLAADLLSTRAIREKGYFEHAPIQARIAEARQGSTSARKALAAVLGVQLWDELFIRGRTPATMHDGATAP